MNKRVKIDEKILIAIFAIIIVCLVSIYVRIIKLYIDNKQLQSEAILIAEKNEQPVFCIKKITLLSSANAIDNSLEKNLQDLSLYQFTDIALQIENDGELTNKNTVKKLYIDNIEINTRTKKGIPNLNYKNYQDFGKVEKIIQSTPERIDFNIVYTNEENSKANYDEPTFYTDCSNPITLEYVNNNLVKGYKIGENNSISFDGRILKSAGVELGDIECYLKFRINIENNLNENYSCWIGFYLPLSDIFEGNSMKTKTLSGKRYDFFCNPII